MRMEFSRDVRAQALHRARWRCERCGARDGLQVHHVGGAGVDRSLFNAMVMCEPCHVAEHRVRRDPASRWQARERRARDARRRRVRIEP